MGLDITSLRKAAEGAMYVSPERLCVTADGELCAEDDPKAVRLLVGKGGSIPAREAAKYGLIADASVSTVLSEAAAATAPAPAPAEAAEDAPEPAGASDALAEEKPEAGKKSSKK